MQIGFFIIPQNQSSQTALCGCKEPNFAGNFAATAVNMCRCIIYIYTGWKYVELVTSNSLYQIQDLKLCWPPAKIGTLLTSGASSTQTLPNRLKLDKPTSVNRISVVATPLNRMGQQHLGNCGFVASRM